MGYLLLTTGMRAAELLALQFSQVHETPIMNYIEIKGKRDKWRRIPLSKKSFDLIQRLKMLMKIEDYSNPKICFNIRSQNEPISYEALRLIAKSASLQLTTNVNSPHWFRRSFITKMLANGVPLYNVMKISGHESIQTTNKYIQDINVDNKTIPFE